MKVFVAVISVALVFVQVYADEDASTAASPSAGAAATTSTESEKTTYKRLIPADVLRDFPGTCFASTKCRTYKIGESWDLYPFCGRSTCVKDDSDQLLELVEDCGPLPLANDKCKLDTDKTNKTAAFPSCCPNFVCEDGAKLEYPEIKTEAAPVKKD